MSFNHQINQLIQQTIKLVENELIRIRKNTIESIPIFRLEDRNCSGATMVANRNVMIRQFPQNGIVAEIGVDQGEFSADILKIAKPKKLHLIDAWNTDRYNENKAQNVINKFKSEIDKDIVEIYRGLSTDAASKFNEEYFDWIYIDTDHSYGNTLKELYLYAPKVKPNGRILGHDYVMGNWISGYKYGVIEAVAEFCVKEDWRLEYITADFSENNSFAITRIGNPPLLQGS